MARRLKDMLENRARASFVGRKRELSLLLECLNKDSPLVYYVHGIPGVGKSTLLDRFSEAARSRASVIPFDCRMIEPTPDGFYRELGRVLDRTIPGLTQGIRTIEKLEPPIILVFDAYEVFHLMDTWLRQVLVPALPEGTRLILASRVSPVARWLASPEWHGLFRVLRLDTLKDEDAHLLLSQVGVAPQDLVRLNGVAHGHPLALRLAGSLKMARPEAAPRGVTLDSLVHELTRVFLEDVGDSRVRERLMAVSVVRRVTQTLLAAICPDAGSSDAYRQLWQIPFIDASQDGLRMHEAVRDSVARSLRVANPRKYRTYRARAWHQLRVEARDAEPGDLWRYTADMLYLVENPVIREAFFPSGSQKLAVEPMQVEDWPTAKAIAAAHDGTSGLNALGLWWRELPTAFHVVRNDENRIVGFYCMFEALQAQECNFQDDPVVSGWVRHLRRDPVGAQERVLFLRRWLAGEAGEAPSPEQAACWLDVKRTYMEMRPRLRRVYLTVRDLAPYATVATQLGFRQSKEGAAVLGEDHYQTAMLDFGPGSVDGWLSRLAADELGIERSQVLDRRARALVGGNRQVSLTPLEYQVMEYLCDSEGCVVSRAELLEKVWGHRFFGGSNVVDAVIKSLRKKMGDRSNRIETVRGFGYRYAPH